MKSVFDYLPSFSWLTAAFLIPWAFRGAIQDYSNTPLLALGVLTVLPLYCVWMVYRDWPGVKNKLQSREYSAQRARPESRRRSFVPDQLTESDQTKLDQVLQALKDHGLAEPPREVLEQCLIEDGLSGEVDAYAVFSILQALDESRTYVSDHLAYSLDQVEIYDDTIIRISRDVIKVAGLDSAQAEVRIQHNDSDWTQGSVDIHLPNRAISINCKFHGKYTPVELLDGLGTQLPLPKGKRLCIANIDSGCVIACMTDSVIASFNEALDDSIISFSPT